MVKNFHPKAFFLHMYFLLITALYGQFFYARTLQANPSFAIFKVINSEILDIHFERYFQIIDQLLPLLSIKIHFPLTIVLFLYAISAPLIGYILWMIINYGYGVKESSWFLSIPFVFFSEILAFGMDGQLIYGLLFFIGFWVLQKSESNKSAVFKNLLFFLSVLTHPLICIVQLLLLATYAITTSELRPKKLYDLILRVVIGLLFWAILGAFSDWTLTSPRWEILPQEMWWYILSFVFISVTIGLAIYRDESHVPLFTIIISLLVTLIITLVLINTKPYQANLRAFYTILWMTSMVFLANRKIEIWPIAIIMIYSVSQIWTKGTHLNKKFTHYENLAWSLRENQHTKYLITEEELRYANLKSWALGVETLLYSTARKKRIYTFYMCKEGELKDLRDTEPNVFLLAPFQREYDQSSLNAVYFDLSVEPYWSIHDTTEQNREQNK